MTRSLKIKNKSDNVDLLQCELISEIYFSSLLQARGHITVAVASITTTTPLMNAILWRFIESKVMLMVQMLFHT